eukprot:m.130663 g.130663  ORF g.130663 m.130663 type:complete len:147 (-) comp9792_c0_seq2:8-448(-)
MPNAAVFLPSRFCRGYQPHDPEGVSQSADGPLMQLCEVDSPPTCPCDGYPRNARAAAPRHLYDQRLQLRGEAYPVCAMDVRAVRNQHLGNCCVAFVCCPVKWGVPVSVGSVGVGSGLEKLCYFKIVSISCCVAQLDFLFRLLAVHC